MAVDWAMLKKGNSKNSDLFLFFLERCKNASIFPELLEKKYVTQVMEFRL